MANTYIQVEYDERRPRERVVENRVKTEAGQRFLTDTNKRRDLLDTGGLGEIIIALNLSRGVLTV